MDVLFTKGIQSAGGRKATFVFAGLLLLFASAAAQQQDRVAPSGTIYGIVFDQHGETAKGIHITADPLGGGLGKLLAQAVTNSAGEYRFENLTWWGTYTVYADDEKAGYSSISTGPSGESHPPEVEITSESPKAEFNFSLPPKAGFVEIHLTNRSTGSVISGMKIAVFRMDEPDSLLFTMGCSSDRVILLPPDKNLLLHVTSDGFREWDESIGIGKSLNVPSGTRLSLSVQLEPLD